MKYTPIPTHGLFQNLIGMEFSRLIVVGYLGRKGANNNWECVCICGNSCQVSGGNLKSGHTQSCGCWQKEKTSQVAKKHGMSRSAEYRTWFAIKKRCYDQSCTRYPRYGGRGITVCDRWLESFEHFLSDMGPRPSANHSIDRINNNGNYEPKNCRWATNKEQSNNTSRNHKVTINGTTKTITQWADAHGLHWSVVMSRVRKGLSGESLIEPSAIRSKFLTFNGICDTYKGWSERTGIKAETISQRIYRNKWSIEKTLTKGAIPCK